MKRTPADVKKRYAGIYRAAKLDPKVPAEDDTVASRNIGARSRSDSRRQGGISSNWAGSRPHPPYPSHRLAKMVGSGWQEAFAIRPHNGFSLSHSWERRGREGPGGAEEASQLYLLDVVVRACLFPSPLTPLAADASCACRGPAVNFVVCPIPPATGDHRPKARASQQRGGATSGTSACPRGLAPLVPENQIRQGDGIGQV